VNFPPVCSETCIHEASHAVVAVHLGLTFDYVTVAPSEVESGDLRLGYVQWGDRIAQAKIVELEKYALANIAPQVALPLFGIERTDEESEYGFSGDELILDILLRFRPDLTRSYLRERVKQLLSPTILSQIQAVSEQLEDRTTLTLEEVLQILKEPVQ
jgi:hypothetical protein